MKFIVEGMTCGHCVTAITRAVRSLEAGARVQVDLANGTVDVAAELDPAFVAAAIESEGYVVRATQPDASAQPSAPACCGGCHA